MRGRISRLRMVSCGAAVVLVLGACGSVPPAPVVKRTTPSGEAPVRGDFYTVLRGDTLYGIAIRNGITVSDLRRWNGLDAEDVLQAGHVLRITGPQAIAETAPAPAVVPAPAPAPSPAPVAGASIPPGATSPQTGSVQGRVIAARPLDPGAATTLAGTGASEATAPQGVKRPYSQAAYDQMVLADAAAGRARAAATAPSAAGGAPTSTPEAAGRAAPPASAPAVAVATPSPAAAPAAAATASPAAGGAPPGVPVSSSGWIWPASGPVLRGFADTSSKGIEIAGRVGDPVYAAAPGRVIFAGVGPRGYGNLIIIKHDQEVLSVYAHNSKVLVKEGQDVGRGQRVAEVGDSDSERPKLHFEVRRGGKPIDPVDFLPRR